MKASRAGKWQLILIELRTHLPFTMVGVTAALVSVFGLYLLLSRTSAADPARIYELIFHASHFGHVGLSAMTAVAIFLHHDRKLWKALPVGLFASLIPCGIADVLFPYMGGKLLGARMEFHLCLIEETGIVLTVAGAGLAAGFLLERRLGRISFLTHGAHVFASSFATMFYMVSFGVDNWLQLAWAIFAITAISVIVPCCSSDIIMPLSLISGLHGHEHLDEHTCHDHPKH